MCQLVFSGVTGPLISTTDKDIYKQVQKNELCDVLNQLSTGILTTVTQTGVICVRFV